MAASPSSAAPMSDIEPPSSPVHNGKSFMTNATEDEDTRMIDATPDPSDRPRGRRGARDSMAANGASQIGKIPHLKKEDGEPLWRKDIQYDFLRAVFDDEREVFTNSYEPDTIGRQCFADLYIDTMSRSSKTSKVLRDKLLSDRDAAKGMAMVCLLVNIGRMNTTLNFFPEMRAQLRTYHAIPSLQAHQDPHAYKQLQDAPRLKSILKGGAEDRAELTDLNQIRSVDVPRTNPVNLLFIMCQKATKIAELHFPPGQEFHDLIMKTNYTSRSRARAFLWLMWFYLESDFTEEGCAENPFGAGVDYKVDVANQGIPRLVEMSAPAEALENVDTQEEVDFGIAKQKMRAKIIAADQQYMADNQNKRGGRGGRLLPAGDEVGPTTGILPRIRPSKHESDIDSVRSTPPPRALGGRQSAALGSTGRRGPAGLKYQIFEGSSPGGGQVIEGIVPRKPRPPTAHQLAVERNRSQRVEYILDKGIRKAHHKARKQRKNDGAIVRALNRLKELSDPFEDSEGEENASFNRQLLSGYNGDQTKGQPFREKGYGGLCQLKEEEDDFGEEVSSYAAAMRRANRRLGRWEGQEDSELGVVAPIKKRKLEKVENGDDDEMLEGEGSPTKGAAGPADTEDEADLILRQSTSKRTRARANGSRRQTNGHSHADMEDNEELDEMEKELLGEAEAEPDEGDVEAAADKDQDEEELDDVDKTLLGLDGESDSD